MPESYHDYARITGTAADPVVDDTDGLKLLYEFESGSGSTATDSATSDGADDGTINGATWISDAKLGDYALNFDGTGDYINVPQPSWLPTGDSSFTVTAWVRFKNYTGAEANHFYAWGNRGTTDEFNALRTSTSYEGLYHYFWGNDFEASGTIPNDTWKHVAVTYDAANSRRELYIDGSSIGSDTPSDPNVQSSDIEVGRGGTSGAGLLEADLDDFRIYDVSKTDSEIQAIYDNTK